METIFILLGVLVIFFLSFMLFRTAILSRETFDIPEASLAEVDAGRAADHLSRLIQQKTVSTISVYPAEKASYPAVQALSALQKSLQEMYPLAHRILRVETLGGYSLLYTWTGKNAELDPVLIMAHQDVTPVEEGTEGAWDEPPYSGQIRGGTIWGRGALDFKCGLAGALEAVEWLLENHFTPDRTICLAFGHDEEIGGFRGARQAALALQKRGITFDSVLDEGGLIIEDIFPGVRRPAALVGLTEKGYVNLELCVETPGGHSSLTSGETSISILCQALGRLQAEPFPAKTIYMRRLLRKMAPELPFGQRFLVANDWLFGGLLESRFTRSPRINSVIRTTSAVTMLAAGVKDNVLPRQARALVNFRIFPGEHIPALLERVERIIGDSRVHIQPVPAGGEHDLSGGELPLKRKARSRDGGEPVPALRMAVQPGEVTRIGGWESPPAADPASGAFQMLDVTIRQVFPEAEVVPFLTPAATDSRHFAGLSEHILRFTPLSLKMADLNRLHGTNECIGVDDFARMVQFYIQWIRNNAGDIPAG